MSNCPVCSEETHLEWVQRKLREDHDPNWNMVSYMGVGISEFSKEDLLLILSAVGRDYEARLDSSHKSFEFMGELARSRP